MWKKEAAGREVLLFGRIGFKTTARFAFFSGQAPARLFHGLKDPFKVNEMLPYFLVNKNFLKNLLFPLGFCHIQFPGFQHRCCKQAKGNWDLVLFLTLAPVPSCLARSECCLGALLLFQLRSEYPGSAG